MSLGGILLGVTLLLYGAVFWLIRQRHPPHTTTVVATTTMTNLLLLQDVDLRKAWIPDSSSSSSNTQPALVGGPGMPDIDAADSSSHSTPGLDDTARASNGSLTKTALLRGSTTTAAPQALQQSLLLFDEKITAEEKGTIKGSLLPPLSLSDLIITDYISNGAVNDVCLVRFRDANLARAYGVHQEENHDEDIYQAGTRQGKKVSTSSSSSSLILKLVYNTRFGHNEITSFERLGEVDAATSERLHILKPIWMQRHAVNPYYCTRAEITYHNYTSERDDDDDGTRQDYTVPWDDYKDCVRGENSLTLPPDFDVKLKERFRAMPTVDVLLMPRLEKLFLRQTARTFRDVKIFFHSMLEVLQVAHAHNVNNIDLQTNRNMYVNRTTGRAILFDWNALIEVGQPTYDEEQHDLYAPPEAWLQEYWGVQALNQNIHAMDVWQAGIAWSYLIYNPCGWQSSQRLQDRDGKTWLQTVIRTLGGSTVIPVNATASVDLADLAGLPRRPSWPRPALQDFTPLLGRQLGGKCKKPSWYMDNPHVPQSDKDLAIDFLRQMLVLSPLERPTVAELLQHPIWNDIPTTVQ